MNNLLDVCPICCSENVYRSSYCAKCGFLMSGSSITAFSILQDQSGFCEACYPEGCCTCRQSPVRTKTKIVYVPEPKDDTKHASRPKSLGDDKKNNQNRGKSVSIECARCIRLFIKLMIITVICNLLLGFLYILFLVHK
jgi:hypothetical protein